MTHKRDTKTKDNLLHLGEATISDLYKGNLLDKGIADEIFEGLSFVPSTMNYNSVLYLHSSIFHVPFLLLRKTIIRLAWRSLHESPSLGCHRCSLHMIKKKSQNCTSTPYKRILDLNRALFPHLSVLARLSSTARTGLSAVATGCFARTSSPFSSCFRRASACTLARVRDVVLRKREGNNVD